MVVPKLGWHHYHVRKRVDKKHEKYPSSKKLIAFFDKYMVIIAIIIPLMTIPQIAKIWINKSAGDFSIISWVAYLVSGSSWFVYSLIHREKLVILNATMWVLMYVAIIIGIILFS